MEESILKSTKKMLQIGEDDPSFDLDVMTHINSAFSTLNDIGVGPDDGFFIETDEELWGNFLVDQDVWLNKAKEYVWQYVKLRFDPPQTPFLLNASQENLQETLVRLSMNREEAQADPDPNAVTVIDGGDPSGDPILE